VAALQFKADGLPDGQEGEIVFPDSGPGKIDGLTVFRLNEAGTAGGAQILDPSNHCRFSA
jgi:hypothetical protein